MDRHRHRALPLILIGLTVVACSTASSPAGSAEPVASAASTTSAAPSAAASAPADASAAPATAYECADLISEAEMQATGLAAAEFLSQEHWTDTPGMPEGQTYCQFFANNGAISIAVSVLTGASFEVVYLALVAAGGGEPLPGIGDEAFVAPDGTGGVARTHGVGITVFITDMSANGLGNLDAKAAVTQILELIVDRV
jgi:hypothetical protein